MANETERKHIFKELKDIANFHKEQLKSNAKKPITTPAKDIGEIGEYMNAMKTTGKDPAIYVIETHHRTSDPELYQDNLHVNRARTNKHLELIDAKLGNIMRKKCVVSEAMYGKVYSEYRWVCSF